MAARLPLFPLSAVLFPAAALPLHIFEPRYRRMLADCLAGDRRFGLIAPGRAAEAPPPGAVGCVAEIRASQGLPDGRSNIVVTGGARFVVTRYLEEDTPYYLAMVEEFTDQPGTAPGADDLARLRAVFDRYYAALRQLSDSDPGELAPEPDAETFTFQVASAIEAEPNVKQQLLETRSTTERTAILLRLLPPLADALGRAAEVRTRAHTNGKGHHSPDLAG